MFRPGQLEIAIKAANSPKYAFLLDAPTGTGKSLVGATVQKLLDKRTVYLCTTKQLQQQILHDFPYAVTLMGRANYPCVEMPGYTADLCMSSEGECKRRCAYFLAKERAIKAELAVLNSAYYLAESNFVGAFTDVPFLVVDEIDTTEDQLMGFIELTVTARQLNKFGIQMPRYKTKHESWVEWAESTLILLRPLISKEPTLWNADIHAIRQYKEVQSLVSKLEFFVRSVNEHWVWEQNQDRWTFKPIWVANYANSVLWSKASKVLAMSATILSAPQISRNIGIQNFEYKVMPSPFPPENKPVYYMPVANLSRGTLTTELPKLAKKVDELLDKHKDAHVLVHTVSYKIRDFLSANLKQSSSRILTHGPKDRAEVLSKFKSSKLPYVLISPSFERGIDLPYDECRVVILAKVPWPSLGSPQISARLHGSKDGQAWYTHRTISNVIQATGRAQRAVDDYCDVYILDSQFGRLYNDNKQMFPDWWRKSLKIC